MNKNYLPKAFLIILVIAIIFAVYKIFQPFLIELIVATILVSIFHRPYEWLAKKLKGRRSLASLLMCVFIVLLIIIPFVNLVIYGAQESVKAYNETVTFLNKTDVDGFIKFQILEKINLVGIDMESIKSVMLEASKSVSSWVASGAANFLVGTTNFIVSLVLMVFAMFFFFVDGQKMLEKVMLWTPLPNKYDREIFKKFRDVSYSTVISTFLTAAAQGFISAIAFVVTGLPAFIPSIFIAFLSLIPYIGSAFIWLPAGIYLLVVGKIWQGIFMILWGGIVVSNVDNLIRAYLIKGKAQVHPIFIIFSILGGISLFGFWGVIIGPLVISLAVTILHIYELEYETVLEK